MTYLLDTTAFSDLMREHPQMRTQLRGVAERDAVVICSIVRGEVNYGTRRLPDGKRRRALELKAANLFSVLPCLSVPSEAGDIYGDVKNTRERRGLSLDENDLWIAATALAVDATLVTRDTDFNGIEGLRVENWSLPS